MFQGDITPPFDDTDDWTFHRADTRHGTHVYHDYPARMIPQIAAKLLTRYGAGATRLFGPYCGTGTSLVEGMAHGLTVIGTDLNPLARLIARAKTTPPDAGLLTDEIRRFEQLAGSPPLCFDETFALPGIDRLCFWFTPVVVARLRQMEAFVSAIADANMQQFFAVAFSETVRDCSNTRSREFKLYRYAEKDLALRFPDVLATMGAKLHRNRAGLQAFGERLSHLATVPSATVYDFDTVTAIPERFVAPESVDIVVTSPYGDSVTTVAYGQYSRLSAAWLRLPEPEKTDRRLMGGTPAKTVATFSSPTLNAALPQIADTDTKRAGEVSAFYADLLASVRNVAATVRRGNGSARQRFGAATVRRGGYVCYVIGNRKVKGVVLPTDTAVRDFFTGCGYKHVTTHERHIPNKRMPARNSPSNVTGQQDATMTQEYIAVLWRR